MSKHTHKSAEARELFNERRAQDRERTQIRAQQRYGKAVSRVMAGGAW